MKYRNIVVLTGAGISAESGIQTFRGNDGLWEKHRIEEVATPEAFAANPSLVQRFYNERRAALQTDSIKPNLAHYALADLEGLVEASDVPTSLYLVTQNIDNLHERAGSKHVCHMHGELLKVRCERCDARFEFLATIEHGARCDCCTAVDSLRPHIVWFGEMPFFMDEIYLALSKADLFISIGTSGNVYPAAGFVSMANEAGAHTIEVNLEPSLGASLFDKHYNGKASETVPALVKDLANS